VATAVRDGGQPGHLHRGDDWDHVIEDLAELERARDTSGGDGAGNGLGSGEMESVADSAFGGWVSSR
jgi:hypothetical protein